MVQMLSLIQKAMANVVESYDLTFYIEKNLLEVAHKDKES